MVGYGGHVLSKIFCGRFLANLPSQLIFVAKINFLLSSLGSSLRVINPRINLKASNKAKTVKECCNLNLRSDSQCCQSSLLRIGSCKVSSYVLLHHNHRLPGLQVPTSLQDSLPVCLDNSGNVMFLQLEGIFGLEESLRMSDEDFRSEMRHDHYKTFSVFSRGVCILSQLILFAFISKRANQVLNTFLGAATIIWPSVFAKALVSLEEHFVGSSVCETRSSDSQIFHQAQVGYLVFYNVEIEAT